VRRRAEPVEQPGGGEHEGARADRGDPRTLTRRLSQGADDFGGGRRGLLGAARHDDGVGRGQRLETPVRGDREQLGGHFGRRRADADAVGLAPVRQPRAAEDLDRRGQVERHHTGQREYGDGMHNRHDNPVPATRLLRI
jgi:hypothetical protein